MMEGEKRRQRFLKLVDGHNPNIHYAHQIFNLVHSDAVLEWLLKRCLTGKNLHEWVVEKHKGQILDAISFIVADVNRAVARPVRLGVEYGRR